MSPRTPELQRHREVTERQVHHLSRLADDLLDVARIQSGRIALQFLRLRLAGFITNVVSNIASLVKVKRHKLLVEQLGEEIYLDGDEVRLSKIVFNLLGNAVKYTPEGGVIRLSIKREDDYAIITVADSGMGMTADTLKKIFDVFSQTSLTPANQGSGSGLGIAIVRKLVALHHGTIDTHRDGLELGSEFIVRLPLHAPSNRRNPTPVCRQPAHETAGSGTPCRLLIVDDNKDVAASFALVLEEEHRAIQIAYDAASALEIASSFAPQVVLLDIGLPDMDGFVLAKRLRELPSTQSALLISISGYGRDEDHRRSAAAGIDVHLVKPLNHSVINDLLEKHRC